MRGNSFHEISSSGINVNKLNLYFTDDQENQEQVFGWESSVEFVLFD